ncbi:hypothetical protein [Pedobacter jejuensis]|uniref:Glycoside hydrolase family 42 N-terminal domain-containing protein n=1 Tax=Pedobacter jejuensis TaxID=1268550 RepID=A0A3N0BXX7_9SPHI|nr:hypothetical protein [Pedobacter jejuensis]RNL54598.1 hypothetical protein D7004_07365 [Pedobacter jejuensis]
MKNAFIALAVLLFFCNCKRYLKPDEVDLNRQLNKPSSFPFRNYLGVNAFEWDFVEDKQENLISAKKIEVIRSFGAIRHYLDWERMESNQGKYTFNPTHAGGAYYDVMYQRLKAENIDVLVCLKNVPKWFVQSYPENERGADNTPVPFNADKNDPKSYMTQAKMAFQFAARYGSNKNIDASLISVDTSKRWTGDDANQLKIGLGLIKYIECNNEPDKWWAGKKAQQTAEEYAANLSAFYDGHKGKLGKNVGVKSADKNIQVVMGGLGDAKPEFVAQMIEWCKKNRGLKPDGKIDLCFDVINYHLYANDAFVNSGKATSGIAPELSELGEMADKFIKMRDKNAPNIPVWVTETGYDVGKTPQSAIPIGSKSSFITQADWNLRTSLLYARHGISRCMFYMLDDAGGVNNPVQYSSSGFVNENGTKRPSADYMLQVKKLLGNYFYFKTLSNQPIVDLYKLNKKEMYVLTLPSQKGLKVTYELDLGNAKQAIVHSLQIGKQQMLAKTTATKNGKLKIEVGETPIFIEKI